MSGRLVFDGDCGFCTTSANWLAGGGRLEVVPWQFLDLDTVGLTTSQVASSVWWLVLLVVGATVGIPLLVRARRRGAWRRELAWAESELVWFARVLLPELRQGGSLEQLTGGWAVGRTRVEAAEDRLTALESAAPDDASRERARTLRDAVRMARGRLQQLAGAGPHDTWALDLDAIIADLEVVLGGASATPVR